MWVWVWMWVCWWLGVGVYCIHVYITQRFDQLCIYISMFSSFISHLWDLRVIQFLSLYYLYTYKPPTIIQRNPCSITDPFRRLNICAITIHFISIYSRVVCICFNQLVISFMTHHYLFLRLFHKIAESRPLAAHKHVTTCHLWFDD